MESNLKPARTRPHLTFPLSLLACLACHDSSSGGGGGATGFLDAESRLNTNPAGASTSHRPRLCATGSTIYAIWEDDRLGDDLLYFNRSTDDGSTWLASDIHVPSSGLGLGDLDIRSGGFSCDGDNVFVVFEEDGMGGLEDIYFNRSTDGGLTWLPAAVKLDPGASGAADSEGQQLVVVGANLYVGFAEHVGGERDVFFTRSTDAGATWSIPVQLDTDGVGASDAESIELCVDGSNVYVVWSDDRNGSDDIYLNASIDGGSTWLVDDVRIDTTAPGSSFSDNPKIGCIGLEVYVAFDDERSGDTAIYFNRSADGGATWLPMDTKLNSDPNVVRAEDPVLVNDGQRVIVGWDGRHNGGEDDVFVNVSTDGGVTWQVQETRLDQDAPGAGDSDGIMLCTNSARVYAVWEDDRNGLDDIYMCYSTDGGTTWGAEAIVEDTPAGSSNSDDHTLTCSTMGVWFAWEDDRNGNSDSFVNGGMHP